MNTDRRSQRLTLSGRTHSLSMEEASLGTSDDESRHLPSRSNWTWFKERARELYAQHGGKVVCIAGQEAFVAETPEEALALGNEAHPDDPAKFIHYLSLERNPRIYAC